MRRAKPQTPPCPVCEGITELWIDHLEGEETPAGAERLVRVADSPSSWLDGLERCPGCGAWFAFEKVLDNCIIQPRDEGKWHRITTRSAAEWLASERRLLRWQQSYARRSDARTRARGGSVDEPGRADEIARWKAQEARFRELEGEVRVEQARELLEAALARGPRRAAEIEAEAQASGVPRAALGKACRLLGLTLPPRGRADATLALPDPARR